MNVNMLQIGIQLGNIVCTELFVHELCWFVLGRLTKLGLARTVQTFPLAQVQYVRTTVGS